MDHRRGILALSPIIILLAVYLCGSLLAGDFYRVPISVAFVVAAIYGIVLLRGYNLQERIGIFSGGAANKDIIYMIWIFCLAGIFASSAKAMGAVDATVALTLKAVPSSFLPAGIFIAACFISMAIGTSVGTIVALTPVVTAMASQTGCDTAWLVAIVVGGAFFGDNLSFISDTTIAATRTQGVEMKDKFRVNGFIAAPAAVVTVILLVIFGRPDTAVAIENLSFDIIKVVPYILVLGLAVAGLNVFVTLAVGIFSAGIIGIVGGELTVLTFAQSIYDGFKGMEEVFFRSLLVGGLSNMVAKQGGIDWLLAKIRGFIKGPKSAQAGIAALAAAADLATANNTVAIIVVGSIAKSVSEEFRVDPRKTASILDIVSCIFQGAIPYGAQFLAMGSLAALFGFTVSPLDVIPLLWYQWLLAAALIVSFFVPFADSLIKKHPWNWETGKAEK